jgi:hypothetical protein
MDFYARDIERLWLELDTTMDVTLPGRPIGGAEDYTRITATDACASARSIALRLSIDSDDKSEQCIVAPSSIEYFSTQTIRQSHLFRVLSVRLLLMTFPLASIDRL